MVDAWGPGTRDKTLFILEAGLYHKNWHPSPTLQGADHQKQEEGGTHPMHTKKRQQNLLISTLALSGKGKKKHKTCPSKFHQRPESRQILDLDSHPPPRGDLKGSLGCLSLKWTSLLRPPGSWQKRGSLEACMTIQALKKFHRLSNQEKHHSQKRTSKHRRKQT